jgi:two-component system, NarL family, sensor histidine kinase DegS
MISNQPDLEIRKLILAEEEQRHRLAVDLHDGPIQYCVASILRLQVMSRGAEAKEFDPVLERMNHTLEGLREMEQRLCPQTLYDFGLAETMDRYIRGVVKARDWKLELELPTVELGLDRALEFTLFRILQHVLEHGCHHHNIDSLLVSMLCDQTEVRLRVRCRCSCRVEASTEETPLGWLSGRVSALGGWSEFRRQPKGTDLIVGFPLLDRES